MDITGHGEKLYFIKIMSKWEIQFGTWVHQLSISGPPSWFKIDESMSILVCILASQIMYACPVSLISDPNINSDVWTMHVGPGFLSRQYSHISVLH